MSGRREQNRLQTRSRVLEAAKEMFPRHGVAGTTAADLARAARISRATFFNHFGSKEELLVELWAEQVGNLGAEISRHLAEPLSTEERIRCLFADLVAALDRRPGYLAVVASELERYSSDEAMAVRSALFHEQVRRIIDAGLEQGDVRRDHDADVLTEMVGAAYQSVLRGIRLDDDYDPNVRGPAAAAFIADAVCRPSAR